MGRMGRTLVALGSAAMAVPLAWLLWPVLMAAVGSVTSGDCGGQCGSWVTP